MTFRQLWWLPVVIAGSALMALVLGVICWLATGGRLYAVQTGSMQPVLNPGDGVLTRPLTYEQLRIGQVVSYKDVKSPSVITTHRVMAINKDKNTFTTQGDSIKQADLPHASSQLLGQAVMVAPGLGRWLDWLRQPVVLVILVYIPVTCLLALSLYRLWQSPPIYYGR